jgi:hypothetical protein
VSTIPWNRDPAFWVPFILLTAFYLEELRWANKAQIATLGQMRRRGLQRGMFWFAHFGFWSDLLLVHPVLAWVVHRLWPLWETRGGLIALCLIVAGYLGARAQIKWSRDAGDNEDAWSKDARPTTVGILHVEHMGMLIGIPLMFLVSALAFQEVPVRMFLGFLAIAVFHLLIGNHWPLRAKLPSWHPTWLKQMSKTSAYFTGAASGALFIEGLYLLFTSP